MSKIHAPDRRELPRKQPVQLTPAQQKLYRYLRTVHGALRHVEKDIEEARLHLNAIRSRTAAAEKKLAKARELLAEIEQGE